MAKYKSKFYQSRHSNSFYSAERIISLVTDWVQPQSVIDVGCGVGTWLDVFKEKGVSDVLGVEGQWVDEQNLVIDQSEFVKTDLEKPFDAGRQFDLAISMEVAEHISESSAATFIQTLTRHAPVVLFSAAIPLQGGKHHVNEQWPDYWRALFKEEGYDIIDCVRPEIWEDDKVEMWYAQNSFIYVRKDKLKDYEQLAALYTEHPTMLSAVLPRFYEFKLFRWPIMKAVRNKIKRSLSKAGKMPPPARFPAP